MKRIPTALAVLALAAIPLFGCGSDDEEPASAASTPAATESAPETSKPAAEETAVKMVDNAFEPKDLTVKVGDTVTWTNDGQLPHTATAEGFDSGSIAPGDTYEWTAEKAGTVSYVCTFHPGMEGTITVN
jgi:plastocyanin